MMTEGSFYGRQKGVQQQEKNNRNRSANRRDTLDCRPAASADTISKRQSNLQLNLINNTYFVV